MNLRQKLTTMTIGSVAVLTILFALALQFQRYQLMEDRQDKVRNLVESAQTIVAYYAGEASAGRMGTEDAQKAALNSVRVMRYDKTEYFFVQDMNGVMLMHPIKPELNGKNLLQVKDKAGKTLFEEMRQVVKASGSGFVSYQWPKPNSDVVAPKISFVQGFAPWGWSIGTGIYVDDVDAKFRETSVWLFGIGVLIAILLGGGMFLLSQNILTTLGGDPAEAAAVTQRISMGDLSTDVLIKQGESKSLMSNIQRMQETLRGMIKLISSNAEQVASASRQLQGLSEGVADRATRQSQSSSTMAAAMEEMSVSVTNVKGSASEAYTISKDAGELADLGSAVIHNATAEMLKISEAVQSSSVIVQELGVQSNQITSIVNTIKEIADQTNLLALNAAIEAARAGEQGRGFAVVADEVRKLAERTALSTTEIAGMVEKIQHGTQSAVNAMQAGVSQVSSGVQLANEAGESINRIREGAQRVTEVVNGISESIHEQSLAGEDITQQLGQIAEMSEESASAIRDTASAARHLQQLSASLHQAIGKFRV
ncbi:MAG: hypothetical protein RIR18_347 [Pseudomonadota bacterium]|jgi:methyl-accepting chemotaxis protein